MAVKNTIKILDYFNKHKGQAFSRSWLRNKLDIDYNTIKEVIKFFLERGMIKEVQEKGVTKYKWRDKNV